LPQFLEKLHYVEDFDIHLHSPTLSNHAILVLLPFANSFTFRICISGKRQPGLFILRFSLKSLAKIPQMFAGNHYHCLANLEMIIFS
jgi:hypothetical protein